MYANTDEGSSAIWVCDGNGIVLETVGISLNSRGPILERINEHYGTSFTGWSDNEIYLRIGDTIPNWNAYEKIEIPLQYLAVTTGGANRYAVGFLIDKVWHVYFNSNNMAWGIDNTGLIVTEMGGMDGLINGLMLPKIREYGIEVETYAQEIVSWNVGDTIPNVEQYSFIT